MPNDSEYKAPDFAAAWVSGENFGPFLLSYGFGTTDPSTAKLKTENDARARALELADKIADLKHAGNISIGVVRFVYDSTGKCKEIKVI